MCQDFLYVTIIIYDQNVTSFLYHTHIHVYDITVYTKINSIFTIDNGNISEISAQFYDQNVTSFLYHTHIHIYDITVYTKINSIFTSIDHGNISEISEQSLMSITQFLSQ